jgi:2-oxoisovalerate dehydrogenase E1 component beta subunit
MTMIQALRSAMDVMLERDDNVVVFGEDVGYFGGVFRCTEGLQAKYGKSRVFDAPIAEGGIVGTAVGMAAYGLRPVVEIQFADYFYPAIGPDRLRGRAPALPLGGRLHRAAGDPHALRRRHLRRADAQPEPGGAVHPCLRPAHGDAQQPVRRQGPADRAIECDDPVIFLEPKRIYNGPFDGHHDRPVVPWSQAPDGRGARGPLHGAAGHRPRWCARARTSRC